MSHGITLDSWPWSLFVGHGRAAPLWPSLWKVPGQGWGCLRRRPGSQGCPGGQNSTSGVNPLSCPNSNSEKTLQELLKTFNQHDFHQQSRLWGCHAFNLSPSKWALHTTRVTGHCKELHRHPGSLLAQVSVHMESHVMRDNSQTPQNHSTSKCNAMTTEFVSVNDYLHFLQK